MRALTRQFVDFLRCEDGPTAVEYAVMLALIFVVCFGAILTFGHKTNDLYGTIGTTIGSSVGS